MREWDQAADLLRYSSHTYLIKWDLAAEPTKVQSSLTYLRRET